tara:strand:- start:15 stop:416 length:402 start_codon:yes stop_codon:yes gene_type:complete
MNIKDKQSKLVEAMKKDPELKKYYKDIEDLNEKQMKQLIKVCTLLNADQIKLLKAEIQFNEDCANQYKKSARILQSKVKTYEADILKGAYDNNNYVYRDNCYCVKCKQQRNINKRLEEIEVQNYENDLNSVKN